MPGRDIYIRKVKNQPKPSLTSGCKYMGQGRLEISLDQKIRDVGVVQPRKSRDLVQSIPLKQRKVRLIA